MLDNDQPEPMTDDDDVVDARPPCMALVPVIPSVQWSRVPEQPASRADFVTHLIATAEYAPQTRSLRRATLGDAQSAYSASQHPAMGAGLLTRQTI
jgi:hypothetical protein